jgi:hypothetical protein
MNDGQNDNMNGSLMDNSTIVIEQTENYVKLAIPKKSRRKHSDLKLVDRDKGVYEVAKSNVYEYGKQKLGDGSVVTVMRLKAVPYEERVKIHAAATAAGLKVKPLDKPKDDKAESTPTRINIADLQ